MKRTKSGPAVINCGWEKNCKKLKKSWKNPEKSESREQSLLYLFVVFYRALTAITAILVLAHLPPCNETDKQRKSRLADVICTLREMKSGGEGDGEVDRFYGGCL